MDRLRNENADVKNGTATLNASGAGLGQWMPRLKVTE